MEKGIISGVEQAIGKMKLREKAMVTVQADYGYGQDGCTELNIPAGAELVYEVRLNNFSKVCRCDVPLYIYIYIINLI